MYDFITNLANGWTVVDLTIMFILLLIAYRMYQKVQAKETLLKFTDIEREQAKDEIYLLNKELVSTKERLNEMTKSYFNHEKKSTESISHWRERALHKKHTAKKIVDSDNWKCINQHYLNFNNGTNYKRDSSQTPTSNSLLFLICDDNKSYLVEKKYFQPVI